MYVPTAFVESDLRVLHDFIERNSFGLLISQVEGKPFASHLPFLLDRKAGEKGMLVGHFARVNPQWQEMDSTNTLAVFSGPHAYISPTWYEAENAVPTWNYLAVHVTGQVTILHDEKSLLDIVQQSVTVYEQTMEKPWTMGPESTFVNRLLAQIVGFKIEITSIEGKFKLNQNHPVARREKVVKALREQGGENATAIADAMQATLTK